MAKVTDNVNRKTRDPFSIAFFDNNYRDSPTDCLFLHRRVCQMLLSYDDMTVFTLLTACDKGSASPQNVWGPAGGQLNAIVTGVQRLNLILITVSRTGPAVFRLCSRQLVCLNKTMYQAYPCDSKNKITRNSYTVHTKITHHSHEIIQKSHRNHMQ